MWRLLGYDEEFVYDYVGSPHAFHVKRGYCCVVSILPHEDEAKEVMFPERRVMFREHPIDDKKSFPVHKEIMKAWLAEVQAAGFGVPLPGFITEAPTCIYRGIVQNGNEVAGYVQNQPPSKPNSNSKPKSKPKQNSN